MAVATTSSLFSGVIREAAKLVGFDVLQIYKLKKKNLSTDPNFEEGVIGNPNFFFRPDLKCFSK